MKNKTETYDQAMKRIEEIVLQLEKGDKSMDELSLLVQEASQLLKSCKQKLRITEEEIAKAFTEEN